jgi:hypothetical protein
LNLGCTAPTALVETAILKLMVAMSTDTEKLASLDLPHRRLVNFNCVR